MISWLWSVPYYAILLSVSNKTYSRQIIFSTYKICYTSKKSVMLEMPGDIREMHIPKEMVHLLERWPISWRDDPSPGEMTHLLERWPISHRISSGDASTSIIQAWNRKNFLSGDGGYGDAGYGPSPREMQREMSHLSRRWIISLGIWMFRWGPTLKIEFF
jgi:hypothetical protein